MPCLELKVSAQRLPEPASRLRSLLEKPGAAILRRNHIAQAPGLPDPLLRNRVRIAAVLAVDLTDPPQEATPASSDEAVSAAPDPSGFAKGLEIWFSDGARTASTFADVDEIPSALALFDAWLRLSRFQPAFERLEQRVVGLHFAFREGLTLGIQGSPSEHPLHADSFFESVAAIPEIDDFRQPSFTVRLPDDGLTYLHDLLRSAAAWLDDNSYPNILGS